MNSRTLSTLAIAGFVLLGTICVGLRYRAIQQTEIAREETLWELTYKAAFTTLITGQEVARLELALPFDTRYCTVLSPNRVIRTIPNPLLRSEVRGPFPPAGNRELWLTTEQDDTYEATASSVLLLSPRPGPVPPLENLTSDARSVFTREVQGVLPVFDDDVRKKAQDLTGDAESPAEKVQRIFEFCKDIATTSDTPDDDVLQALTNRNASALARARTMVTLCRALRLPARLVTGFFISQGKNVKPQVWVEVFQSQAWVPYDPTNGWSLTLPMQYVPVARNSDQVYSAENLDTQKPLSLSFSISSLDRDPNILKAEIRHPIQIFNLMRLPVPMHTVMTILLLLPFAALITAVLRNVVGLQTFGTFSPALLAMSFIYANLTTGLAILVIVVGVGLIGRMFLERLRLLMVPRLSIILTTAILCVVFGISILYYMVEPVSAEVVLLPLVIMTMLIERFHVTAEEDGMVYTLQLAAGTLLVAILCYLVLVWERVGELVLTYPEIHFFTIAAFIYLGRYAGYRMTELWRFKDLVGPSETGR
jgi:transglutaminase-like putative cysteine protease